MTESHSATEPSISIRKWIRFPPSQAEEPTSTLVLTTARNRIFVDIRWKKPSNDNDAETALPSNGADPSPAHPTSSTASLTDQPTATSEPLSNLDWAFAGLSRTQHLPISSSTTSTTSSTGPAQSTTSAESRWLHWLDSRTAQTHEYDPTWRDDAVDHEEMWDRAKDRGVMVETDEGALEVGEMVVGGALRKYEELWGEVSLEVYGGSGEGGGRRKAWVAAYVHVGVGSLGVVVRVGQYVQGVVRDGERFAAERWELNMEDGKWERKVKFGDLTMPCAWTQSEDERLPDVGEKLTQDGREWECIECEGVVI